MELIYENETLDSLKDMLRMTSITGNDPRIETYDINAAISKLKECDEMIENSYYIYANKCDLMRLCALKGFDGKNVPMDVMRKMLIDGKNDPHLMTSMYARFDSNIIVSARMPQCEISDYKNEDLDILKEYIFKSKHGYGDDHRDFSVDMDNCVELLIRIDKLIIDSNYMDANEHDIERLCHMRSIPLSDDLDKMRADLRSFGITKSRDGLKDRTNDLDCVRDKINASSSAKSGAAAAGANLPGMRDNAAAEDNDHLYDKSEGCLYIISLPYKLYSEYNDKYIVVKVGTYNAGSDRMSHHIKFYNNRGTIENFNWENSIAMEVNYSHGMERIIRQCLGNNITEIDIGGEILEPNSRNLCKAFGISISAGLSEIIIMERTLYNIIKEKFYAKDLPRTATSFVNHIRAWKFKYNIIDTRVILRLRDIDSKTIRVCFGGNFPAESDQKREIK